MPSYTVYLTGSYSDSITVDADSEEEAEELAREEFEDNGSIYLNSLGATVGFDDVSIDQIDEEEE